MKLALFKTTNIQRIPKYFKCFMLFINIEHQYWTQGAFLKLNFLIALIIEQAQFSNSSILLSFLFHGNHPLS